MNGIRFASEEETVENGAAVGGEELDSEEKNDRKKEKTDRTE